MSPKSQILSPTISTYSYIWKLGIEDCLDHLESKGYRRFEVQLTEPHCWPTTMDAGVRKRVERRLSLGEARVGSLNLGSFDNNFASSLKEVRNLSVDLMSSVINLAQDWGVKAIVMSPGHGRPLLPPPIPLLEDGFRWCMDQLLPIAERANVDLLLENIPFTFLPRAKSIVEMVESIDHPRLAVCYDVANAVFAHENIEEGLHAVRKCVRLIHFSDTGLASWKHDRIGAGIVKFDIALRTMAEIAYEGPLVLEIIESDADTAIEESVSALTALGKAAA